MSTLSDVQALYSTLQDTWAKSRAHVIAHAVLVVVVFGICRASALDINLEAIDPKQLSENQWYILAKETGIVYVAFLLPILALAVYGALLKSVGTLLVSLLFLIFPPSSQPNVNRHLSPETLEPIALTMGKEAFSLSELQERASCLLMRYRPQTKSQKSEQWNNFQQSVSRLTKNALVYLGDYSFFLVIWIAIFNLLPKTAWTQANESRFWHVAVFLAGLVCFAWFRACRAVSTMPSLVMIYVSAMIRVDPQMKDVLEASNENLDSVREKLNEILRKDREESYPSLLNFIKYKLGIHASPEKMYGSKNWSGFPFPAVFRNGELFAWDKERHARYERRWLTGYIAFLYYRLHMRLLSLARSLWQFARFIVTGVP